MNGSDHNGTVSRKQSLISALMLLIASIVWGFAFVSQSVGAEYVGPLTFLTSRTWIAVIMLLPITLILGRKSGDEARGTQKVSAGMQILGGAICGTALFFASYAQQAGIAYTTTAKAGFITTLYVILVPILSIFLHQMPEKKIWFCVALGVVGLYCLCRPGGGGSINKGDLILMLCALIFSIQILAVNYFIQRMEGLKLSFLQTLTEAVLATVFMLIFEQPDAAALRSALPAILYAGIMSSGVGYTLQIIGQKGLDPTVASLIMCLESVFSAIGGWMILGQKLSGIELFGCILMFAAIIISQIPVEGLMKKKAA